jgi:MATE family multidrug resistance protein
MSVSVVWMNAVTGTGNSKMNLLSETAAITFYCIYVYIVLEKLNLPIAWGWASEWIYWTTILVPSYWYIRSGRWMGKKI